MNSEMGCSVMCRACMKVDGVLLPMYGDDMISKKNLPDKLADLTSIQIDKYDGLPTVLCAKCAYRTDAFYDFKLQVQATERKLRKMFRSTIAQNIPLKAEIISHDTEINKSDQSCKEESHCAKSSQQSLEHTSLSCKDVTEGDVKPNLEENQCEEEVRVVDSEEQREEPEMINFVENTMEEEMGLCPLDSLNHILISNLNNMTGEKEGDAQNIKAEVPDEIENIFQSKDYGYTLIYIPTGEDTNYDSHDSQQVVHLVDNSEGKDSGKKMFDSASKKEGEPEEYTDGKGCSSELVLWSSENSRNGDEVTEEKEKWTTGIPYDIIENEDEDSGVMESKCSGQNLNASNDDDSDSDYFVDPQENLLGSLNDTILRIKEIKVDGDEINYQCTLCMQNYEKLTGVLIHTVDNHVPSSGPFFCVVCEKDCESHRDLRSHVKSHSGRFPYTCFICNKAYSMKRYLKRHMSCHTDFPRHRCPKCGMRFNMKNELETHVRIHVHGGPPYACSQCPRVFNHKGNYKRHLISHLDPHGLHLPKYPCEVCGKRFVNNRTLETHMRVHTGEKPFQCDICSRSFSQQGNLLNHLRIHSNPRSYTCEVCGKRFNQRATLRDHSLLHTGEKPYVCNVCGVAFTFSAALRRHMWTHASDKPFGCEICNARFVGKYDIKRHMKIHTDRPKTKRRRNQSKNTQVHQDISKDENPAEAQMSPDSETIFIEHQVLLAQDPTQIVPQEEAEKENVDALFNLIQYG